MAFGQVAMYKSWCRMLCAQASIIEREFGTRQTLVETEASGCGGGAGADSGNQ